MHNKNYIRKHAKGTVRSLAQISTLTVKTGEVDATPGHWAGRSPVCEDVLEADEGLCEGAELVHGGVDAVGTRVAVWNLLTVGDGEEKPTVDLKRLPVGRSHRLQAEGENSENSDMTGNHRLLSRK